MFDGKLTACKNFFLDLLMLYINFLKHFRFLQSIIYYGVRRGATNTVTFVRIKLWKWHQTSL